MKTELEHEEAEAAVLERRLAQNDSGVLLARLIWIAALLVGCIVIMRHNRKPSVVVVPVRQAPIIDTNGALFPPNTVLVEPTPEDAAP